MLFSSRLDRMADGGGSCCGSGRAASQPAQLQAAARTGPRRIAYAVAGRGFEASLWSGGANPVSQALAQLAPRPKGGASRYCPRARLLPKGRKTEWGGVGGAGGAPVYFEPARCPSRTAREPAIPPSWQSSARGARTPPAAPVLFRERRAAAASKPTAVMVATPAQRAA